MMRQLRDIMDIKWYDKITNDQILNRAHLPWMADILIEKNLRWLGHVQRMENDRLSRQLLCSQLCEGKRCGEKKHEASTDQPEILADYFRQQSCMEICYQTKTMR